MTVSAPAPLTLRVRTLTVRCCSELAAREAADRLAVEVADAFAHPDAGSTQAQRIVEAVRAQAQARGIPLPGDSA